MQITTGIGATRDAVAAGRRDRRGVGLVPTMGALHEGHFALIRRCRAECGLTVVSIFVNPTQFGPREDLAAYPRPFEQDCAACRELGVDLVFAPDAATMYPQPNLTWVDVEQLGDHLCGADRPGHFRGVATVVAKLLNIVQPDAAYFGRKDAQQLAIIRRMVSDLNFPVDIVACETVREPDGLARSSRNAYLSAEQRQAATCLYRALREAAALVSRGVTDVGRIRGAMAAVIQAEPGAAIDYISIVDKDLLQPVTGHLTDPALVAVAVRLGPARLIDNIVVDPARTSL